MALMVVVALGCGRKAYDGTSDSGVDANQVDDDGGDGPTFNANVVFVTSTSQPPSSIGSLDAADVICQGLADGAGLEGTYVAWLSSSTVNARDRVGTARGWVRPDGRPVADRVEDLQQGRMYHPIRIDENGDDLNGAAPSVATGTKIDGSTDSDNCGDYSDPNLFIETGSHGQTTNDFTAGAEKACSDPFRLYCFGVDRSEPLVVTPAEGRLAFMSLAPLTMAGGIEEADAICAGEASTAGISGTFKAYMATSTASAASRFDLNGPTWVRIDGIAMADTALDFASGNLHAPLNVSATLTYSTGRAWTGADDPFVVGSLGSTCQDWTDPLETSTAGRSNSTTSFFKSSSAIDCVDNNELYCLQE
jgi:hypothetical protein